MAVVEPELSRSSAGYADRAIKVLTAAITREARDDTRQTYGPVSIDDILGPIEAAIEAYVQAMTPAYAGSWEDGEAHALDGTGYTPRSLLTLLPSDYEPLVIDSRLMVDYDRASVRKTVAKGMDEGLPPVEIARLIMEHEAFSPARALQVARTENVRSQESGYQRRIEWSASEGIPIVGHEWLSDPLAAMFDRVHNLMHGKTAPIGGKFTLPSGVVTEGPGLSGVAGEDINCRCCRRALIRRE